ncbi:MAG: hypothetical protein HQL26_08500 [Candidatus Omnitrophica bacterium]|nr:hypothetical protein [Candidatus Omnitrophota bacterium]
MALRNLPVTRSLVWGVFFISVILIYVCTMLFPFVHDEKFFILLNPYIHSLDIKTIFQTEVFSTGEALVNSYYRPVLELINRLLYRVFGPFPAGYHAFNFILHFINGVLLFSVLKGWLKKNVTGSSLLSTHAAFWVSLLFLIHPVQTESVACISGMSNIVYAFFILWCFLSYQKMENQSWWGLVLGLSFFAGLMAKEQAVALPIVLFAADWLLGEKKIIQVVKNKWLIWTGLLVIFVLYFLFRRFVAHTANEFYFFSFSEELWLRVRVIPLTLLNYFKIIIFPSGLHYYRSTDIFSPWAVPCLGLWMAALAVIWILQRMDPGRRRMAVFGLIWFFIFLLPVLNIVPLINEYSFILSAEHFLYLPLAGILIFFYAVGDAFVPTEQIQLRLNICWLISAVFLTLSFLQVWMWRGEIPIFEKTIKYEPDFGRGRELLGVAYADRGLYHKALEQYEVAGQRFLYYRSNTTLPAAKILYGKFAGKVYYEAATAYLGLNQRIDALVMVKKSLRYYDTNIEALNLEGVIYSFSGQHKMAKKYYEKVLAIKPDNAAAQKNLDLCLKALKGGK